MGWDDDEDTFYSTGDVMDLIMNDDSVMNDDSASEEISTYYDEQTDDDDFNTDSEDD